jgi:hypothetical protein
MIKIARTSLFAAAVFAASAFTASVSAADTPSTGLGQSWPNAADVSASPHWHVYVFVMDGVRYVQVNDTNGGVRSAIATAGGQVLVLPIGSDAQDTTTAPATTSSAETVYRDDEVTIQAATPSTTGVTQFTVSAATPCSDPEDCGNHVVTGQP